MLVSAPRRKNSRKSPRWRGRHRQHARRVRSPIPDCCSIGAATGGGATKNLLPFRERNRHVSIPVMPAFEHLSVLASIIVGLSVSQVLFGLGQLVRRRGSYKPDALYLLCNAIIL